MTNLTHFSCPRSDMARKTGFISIRSKMRSCFSFPRTPTMKKIPMFASFSMMLLSLAQNVMSKEECYIKTNGCSVPGGLPFFYKTTFTPACDKHDVCYSCVRIQKSVISNYVHNPFTQFFFYAFPCFYRVCKLGL